MGFRILSEGFTVVDSVLQNVALPVHLKEHGS